MWIQVMLDAIARTESWMAVSLSGYLWSILAPLNRRILQQELLVTTR